MCVCVCVRSIENTFIVMHDYGDKLVNVSMFMCITVAEHLTAQHSAIKMLHSRVKLVLRYVQAVQSGELQGNQEVLRAACSLGHRLPVLNSPKFRADFYNVSINYISMCSI